MQDAKLLLHIVQPLESKTVPIYWVQCMSPTGSFLIGPDHMPLISRIKGESEIEYENSNQEKQSFFVSGGIVFVQGNAVTIILE